mmetsp:Transcript_25351/g.45914  ORF Transcript_25351/g.45914 Transcript_25351/m.45914 type:complete len:229 (-) Transcript_25351:452-1138(-)
MIQVTDFKHPMIEKIIMRSSLKNFMTRITRTTRTTRATRSTRSTETGPNGVPCSLSIALSMISVMVSMLPIPTQTTSRMFQDLSSVLKKSMSPSHHQRRARSIAKSIPKVACKAKKSQGVLVVISVFANCSSNALLAKDCVWMPMKMLFKTIKAPLTHSYSLLLVSFSRGLASANISVLFSFDIRGLTLVVLFFFFWPAADGVGICGASSSSVESGFTSSSCPPTSSG